MKNLTEEQKAMHRFIDSKIKECDTGMADYRQHIKNLMHIKNMLIKIKSEIK